mgnify:FL=1
MSDEASSDEASGDSAGEAFEPAYADPDNPYLRDPDTDFAPVEELTREEAQSQAAALREAIREHVKAALD